MSVSEDAQMKYKPKSVAALQIALGGLPDRMRVQADPDIRVSAKTVGELRKVKAWPENLAVAVPQERLPGSAVMVSKASVATRFALAHSRRRARHRFIARYFGAHSRTERAALQAADIARRMRGGELQ